VKYGGSEYAKKATTTTARAAASNFLFGAGDAYVIR
jgi:hypothetical protein